MGKCLQVLGNVLFLGGLLSTFYSYHLSLDVMGKVMEGGNNPGIQNEDTAESKKKKGKKSSEYYRLGIFLTIIGVALNIIGIISE